MKEKLVKSAFALLMGSLMFSGCAETYTKVVIPVANNHQANIVANQDTTMNSFARGSLRRTNYKYALAAAATTTINNGFQYFSIIKPLKVKELFISNSVKTVEDAYRICDEGKDSFRWSWSYRPLLEDLGSKNINRCDLMLKASYPTGLNYHEPIYLSISMSNNYVENSGMINAKDALSSKLLKDLDLSDIEVIK